MAKKRGVHARKRFQISERCRPWPVQTLRIPTRTQAIIDASRRQKIGKADPRFRCRFLRACFKTIKAPVPKETMKELLKAEDTVEFGEFSRKRPSGVVATSV